MKFNRQIVLAAGAGFLAATIFCFAGQTNVSISPVTSTTNNRPANWARPLTLPGVTNFYQVTTNLYRGAQPTAAGMAQLKVMGIKTVINLRSFHSDKDEVAGTGLQSIRFEEKPWHAEVEDVVGFFEGGHGHQQPASVRPLPARRGPHRHDVRHVSHRRLRLDKSGCHRGNEEWRLSLQPGLGKPR
jgi:hypothetical protein